MRTSVHEAVTFEVFPWDVVTFRANEAEDVLLAAVLADEGGGQTEAAAGLDFGGHAEYRGGQEVHFVVNDQPPVPTGK